MYNIISPEDDGMKKPTYIAALCAVLLLMDLPAAVCEADPAASPTPDAAQVQTDAAAEEAAASEPRLTAHGLSMLDHSVRYPQLTGLADEALQADINQRILDAGNIEALLNRMPMVIASSIPLTADYTAVLQNDVLSVAMSAEGPVYDGRATQVWSTVNIDLRTGAAITLKDLLTDAGLEALEALLEEDVAPALSPHLLRSELTPLPETFVMDAQGLTLYYPIGRLSTLSGRAGAIQLQWYELTGLELSEGSAAERLGAVRALTLDSDSPALIADWVQRGQLPGIPVTLGGSMKEATDAYRMLIDPDLCESGRMFALEDAAFRDAWLLTDALQRGWDDSVIQGIRTDRISLYGLCTGVTRRDSWLGVLGDPYMSVTLQGDRAEAWRLPDGISDYYVFGEHRLRLHSDEQGVLTSVFLLP